MKKKAQAGFEFIILVGALLFFFIIFFGAILQNKADKIKESRDGMIMEIAMIVRDEISWAFESKDGYTRNFEVPGTVGDLEYEISIEENLVYVRTTNGKHAITLPVFGVIGEPDKGSNVIRKEVGIVYLNEDPPV